MLRHNIPKAKINNLRRQFIAGKFNRVVAARTLGICRTTVNLYVKEFNLIREHYPEKLNDMNFFMPVDTLKPRAKELNAWLDKNLLAIILEEVGPKLKSEKVWKKYHLLQPDGYSFTPFKIYFFKYCASHDITLNCTKRIETIPEEDYAVIRRWRNSNDHQRWQIAVMLDAAHTRKSLLKTCEKIECCFKTALRWIDLYQTKGLPGFEWSYTVNERITKRVKDQTDNLIHLIHQSPKIYGVDKTSWTMTDLAVVYTKEYGPYMSQASISVYLRKNNIRYKSSREVLTSPDPLYKEKYAAIQSILENLGEKEKFFSIDEYGPFAVRAKGGKVLALPGERPSYPQMKTSKGWFVCTAALELSANQVIHFYSKKKDTEEMIKLITLLLAQYPNEEKLYLSWDAASWHASRKLHQYIGLLNSEAYRLENHTPEIAIAPLPSCAQFLNVIESVFSGMSKSIIRNSNYDTEEDCKAAIDQYFVKRNAYYLQNPKKAGNKIWGKERVKPVFDKGNMCKGPRFKPLVDRS
jgi:hypothetical protein